MSRFGLRLFKNSEGSTDKMYCTCLQMLALSKSPLVFTTNPGLPLDLQKISLGNSTLS